MDRPNSELWQAALGQLELSVSAANFNTWIKTLSLGKITKSKATILAPNFMTKNYVQHKFTDVILESLQQVDNSIKQVDFALNQKIQKPASVSNTTTLFTQVEAQDTQKITSSPPPSSTIPPIQEAQLGIQKSYTFDSFIVGSSNRLAFSAAQLVVEKPGQAYNPLFLYGPAGVGKTHLMWAIRNEITKREPNFTSLYITSEKFTNDYVNAIRRGEEFTDKYRKLDVLLVDDMQFIAGKEKTQEEFFHTFNTLHQNSKQIILCSDRPPKEIPTLEERLRTRFEWGMVADISHPDLETRIAIILNKAASQDISLSPEVAEYIANVFETNIRELEGAIKKMVVYSKAHQSDLSLALAQQVFGGMNTNKKILDANQIINRTAEYYRVTPQDILGTKRDKEIAIPRQIIMFLLREDLGLSFPKIASDLGGKDHTTIMYGSKKMKDKYEQDQMFAQDITKLREFIQR